MKELNEMSLKELFELQRRLGKAIEERVKIGEGIRERKRERESHTESDSEIHTKS